jgi:hypothetical protein
VLAPSTPADPDENVTLATITAKYPGWPHFEEWKCNEGVYYDWYVAHFCCIQDWITDLFPPCNDAPFCWHSDVVPKALQACRKYAPYKGFLVNKNACCWAPGGISAQDKYTDPTTGSKCLVGFALQAPGPGSNEDIWGLAKECCPDTCNYFNPTEDTQWMCIKANDLGWAVVGDKWVKKNANACNLHAVRDAKVAGALVKNKKVFDCAAAM